MKRLENYQKPCNNNTHGYEGPIAISNGGQIMPVAQDFLRASHAIGVPYSDDIQGPYIGHIMRRCVIDISVRPRYRTWR